LTVDGDGSWGFDLDDQLDHVDDGANDENFALITGAGQEGSVGSIDFSSVITATDADGDSAPALPGGSFAVTVQDDVPRPEFPEQTSEDGPLSVSAYVDEDELATADGDLSDGITDGDGDIDEDVISGLGALVSPGADEDVSFSLDTSSIDGSGLVTATGGTPVTSSGVALKFWAVDSDNVIGYADTDGSNAFNEGDREVFRLTDNGDGTFTFDLKDQIDHDNVETLGAGDTATLDIDLTGLILAEDFDGDEVALNEGSVFVTVENDVPSVQISVNAEAALAHDETATVQDDTDAAGASLPAAILAAFNAVPLKGDDPDVAGADKDNDAIGFARGGAQVVGFAVPGPGADEDATISFAFVDPAGADSGVDTTEGADIFLFLEGDLIVGRVGDVEGDAAFAIALDGDSGELFLAQYLSVLHVDANDHDSSVALTSDAVQVEATLTDSDGDSVSDIADIGGLISFEDDGPAVVVDGEGEGTVGDLALNLDETIDPDDDNVTGEGEDYYNAGLAEAESMGGGGNGDTDDIAGQFAVDGVDPIGRLETAPGALSGLFSVAPDAGSDGEQSISYGFALALSGEGLATTLAATQPAAGGNPDSDGGDAIDFTPYADATIYLFTVDAATVEGRVGGVGGPVALRITVDDPDTGVLGDETLVVEQLLAIDHGDDGNLYDTELPLNLVGGSLGVTLSATVTDGDDDTATDDHTVTLVDAETTFVSIDDDGPQAALALVEEASLTLDESVGADAGDTNADADDIDAGNPDPFGGAYGDPIGAASATLLNTAGVDFGTDGSGGADIALALAIVGGDGADSGLATTDGTPVLLFAEADGTITGRTGDAAGPVVFAISVDDAGVVTVAQYDALEHADSPLNHDEAINFADGVLTAAITVTDGDGDTDTASVDIGGLISFEDDGPTVTLAAEGENDLSAFALELDETIQPDGAFDATYDRYNPVGAEGESGGGTPNGGADDVDPGAADMVYNRIPVLDTAPTSDQAAGSLTTAVTGGLATLFDITQAFGSDGPASTDSLAYSFALGLSGALTSVETNLTATARADTDLADLSEAARTIHLVEDGSGNILGVIGQDTADPADDFVALRISVVNGTSPTDAQLEVEQFLPIDHGNEESPSLLDEVTTLLAANAEEAVELSLTVEATDGDGDTASDTLTVDLINDTTSPITIDDTGPVAVDDVAEVNASTVSDFNVVIVFDRSGSMSDDPDGAGGFGSRLDLAKAAVADLLAAYQAAGGTVNVLVVDFSSTAATSGWTTVAGANAYLSPLSASGLTNYEAATSLVQSQFPSGTPTADANVLYFLTDGQPTTRTNDGAGDPPPANPLDADNLTAAEQLAWETFLDANAMPSYGVGIGTGVTESGLEPVAFPGDPIVVVTETELSATLVDTVPPPNTVEGTILDTIANDQFGFDGPADLPIIMVVHHGGLSYTLADPTGGDGDPSNDATVDGTVMTIPTELGGTLQLDFGTGEYIYTAPAIGSGIDEAETFTYTIADGDGDTSTADLTITVLANDAPVAANDSVITNITDGSELILPDAALVHNDSDPEGDPLVVHSVSGAVNGTLGLGAFALPYVSFTPTGAFPGADGQFTYQASDGKALSGPATVDVIGDTEGALEGTAGSDILLAGDADDVLSGNGGNDVLIGGKGNDTMSGGAGSDMFLWSVDHLYPQPHVILAPAAIEMLGGGSFENEDLADYDFASGTASLLFDGSAVFTGGATEAIDAVHVLDNGHIVLSTVDDAAIGGLAFEDEDMVEYDPVGGTATLFLDGDAVFTAEEDIDAAHVMDNGHIILSTTGGATIGGLTFEDGDLVEYDPVGGTATLYFDEDLFADDVDINAVHVLDNGHIVLSTTTGTTLGGLTFEDGDLVEYDPVAGTSSLFFDEDLYGSNADTEAAHVVETGPWVDSIDDFTTGPGGDVLNFADVFAGGPGDGLSLADLEAGGYISFDSSSDVGGAAANDTVIGIDADGAGGTYSFVVVVNVLDVTLSSADTANVIV
jgi:hypothetical protein